MHAQLPKWRLLCQKSIVQEFKRGNFLVKEGEFQNVAATRLSVKGLRFKLIPINDWNQDRLSTMAVKFEGKAISRLLKDFFLKLVNVKPTSTADVDEITHEFQEVFLIDNFNKILSVSRSLYDPETRRPKPPKRCYICNAAAASVDGCIRHDHLRFTYAHRSTCYLAEAQRITDFFNHHNCKYVLAFAEMKKYNERDLLTEIPYQT